jgi:hypothetical protein
MEQEDLELEVSLGYVVRPCLKKKKNHKQERERRKRERGERTGGKEEDEHW